MTHDALHAACEKGDEEEVRRLLDEGECDVNGCAGLLDPPLFFALPHPRIVKLLIDCQDLDLGAQADPAENVLIRACLVNPESALLIAEDPRTDLNWETKWGETALFFAANQTPELISAIINNKEFKKILAQDFRGRTALHIAMPTECLDVFLRDGRLSLDTMDRHGNSPIMLIRERCFTAEDRESVDILLTRHGIE